MTSRPSRDHSAAALPAELTTSVAQAGESTTITVSGELDVHTAPQLRSTISDAVDAGARSVIVDIDGLTFLDSTGIGALVSGLDRSRKEGGTLSVVCGQRRLLRVFELTGMTETFALSGTR